MRRTLSAAGLLLSMGAVLLGGYLAARRGLLFPSMSDPAAMLFWVSSVSTFAFAVDLWFFPWISIFLGVDARTPSSRGILARMGALGFVLGALIGFLLRPSSPLVGQLPFLIVISRGGSLEGIETVVVPLAQRSFNVVVAAALIGVVVLGLVGVLLSKTKIEAAARSTDDAT